GRLTDQELTRLILQGRPGTPMPGFARTLDSGQVAALVALLRVMPTAERQRHETSPAAATFSTVRRQLDSAVALRSDKIAFDAYLTFAQVETEVHARNAALAGAPASSRPRWSSCCSRSRPASAKRSRVSPCCSPPRCCST